MNEDDLAIVYDHTNLPVAIIECESEETEDGEMVTVRWNIKEEW